MLNLNDRTNGMPQLTGDVETDVKIWEMHLADAAVSDATERSPSAVALYVAPVMDAPVVVAPVDGGWQAIEGELSAAVDRTPVDYVDAPTLENGREEDEEREEAALRALDLEAQRVATEDAERIAAEAEAPPVVAPPTVALTESGINMGHNIKRVGTRKVKHHQLMLDGACSQCARCCMPLTDAVSIERGLGPDCSNKGYLDVDPVDPDEMQAMIILSDWPELCDHLSEHWKPKGIRGLMNGLVRICSLNRRSPVHKACCDAIELLGYKHLANVLRESLAVVSIKNSTSEPGSVEVWVHRSHYNQEYRKQVYQIFGAHFVRNQGSKSPKRGKLLIPLETPATVEGEEAKKFFTYCTHPADAHGEVRKVADWMPDGVTKVSNKALLWHLLLHHFEGLVVKTDKGGVYIRPVKKTPSVAPKAA